MVQAHPNTKGGFTKRRPARRLVSMARLGLRTLSAQMHGQLIRAFGKADSQRVLLICESPLMFEYSQAFLPVLQALEKLRVAFYVPDRVLRRACEQKVTYKCFGPWAAWLHWDLKIFPDHCPLQFPVRDGVSILASHGLVKSRSSPSGSFYFDRNRALLQGKPVYDYVLSPSWEQAAFGESLMPELRGRIRVVGDIRVDRMLADAAALQKDLSGIGGPPRLLVMSTWGQASLLESLGKALLPSLLDIQLRGIFDVTITSHPNLWDRSKSSRDWESILVDFGSQGLAIELPGSPWEPTLASADLVLSDHTSLMANYLFLNRPILLAPVADGVVADDTLFAWLKDRVPSLDPDLNLEEQLVSALMTPIPPEASRKVDDLVDSLGRAGDAHKELIMEALAQNHEHR